MSNSIDYLCYLVYLRNDANRRRKNHYGSFRRIEKKHHNIADTMLLEPENKDGARHVHHQQLYERMKWVGKRRMKLIKKVKKDLDARLDWDAAGGCKHVIYNGHYIDTNEIERRYLSYLADKELLGR